MSHRESSNTLPSKIPVLDGSNYCQWEHAMKAFLQTKGLFKLLRVTYTEPQLLTAAQIITYNNVDTPAAEVAGLQRQVDLHAKWEDNNEWILGYINLKLSASIQQIMTNVTNARTLWNNLVTNYGMTRSAGIFMYFQAVTADGLTLPNNVTAMILLKAIPRNWDNFARMILATTSAKNLTTAWITPLIQEECFGG